MSIQTWINVDCSVKKTEYRGECSACKKIGELFYLLMEKQPNNEAFKSSTICIDCLSKNWLMGSVGIRSSDFERPKHANKENKKLSVKRENQVAKDIGGKVVAQSGAGTEKGDARNSFWMIEDKFTRSRSFMITKNIVSKAIRQAYETGREPAIRIGLGDGTEIVVVLWKTFVDHLKGTDASNEEA